MNIMDIKLFHEYLNWNVPDADEKGWDEVGLVPNAPLEKGVFMVFYIYHLLGRRTA
jgi:hypothetical protein